MENAETLLSLQGLEPMQKVNLSAEPQVSLAVVKETASWDDTSY